jgi:hypothetical protein
MIELQNRIHAYLTNPNRSSGYFFFAINRILQVAGIEMADQYDGTLAPPVQPSSIVADHCQPRLVVLLKDLATEGTAVVTAQDLACEVLYVLQSLCEGQHKELQPLLCSQLTRTGSLYAATSVNVVRGCCDYIKELVNYLVNLVSSAVPRTRHSQECHIDASSMKRANLAFKALTEVCTGCDGNKRVVLKAGLMVEMFTMLGMRIAPKADRYGNRLSVWSAIFNETELQIAMLDMIRCLLSRSSDHLSDQIYIDFFHDFDEEVIVLLMKTLVDPLNPVMSLQKLSDDVSSSESAYGTRGYQRIDARFAELEQEQRKVDQISTVCRQKYDPLRLHLCQVCFMLLCEIRDLRCTHGDSEASRLVENLPTYRFFAQAMGRIEIVHGPSLHRVYFPIPGLPATEIKNMDCDWVYQTVCEKVIDDKDHKKKMSELFKALSIAQVELEHRIRLNKNPFTNYLSDRAQIFKDGSFYLAVFINVLMLFTFDASAAYNAPKTENWNWETDFDKATVQDASAAFITKIAGFVQTFMSCIMVAAHLVTFIPVVVRTKSSASLRDWHAKLSEIATITAFTNEKELPIAVFFCFRVIGLLHIRGHVLLYRDFVAFLDPQHRHLKIIYWSELNPKKRPAWRQYAICLYDTSSTGEPVLKLRFGVFSTELLAHMQALYDFHHPPGTSMAAGSSVDDEELDEAEHDNDQLDVEAAEPKIDSLEITTNLTVSTSKVPKISEPSFSRRCVQVILYALKTPRLLYYTIYLLFSFLGNLVHPFFFCFHLLDLVARSRLLQQVLRAVTANAHSLALTFGLIVICLYIYSIFGFAIFRDRYKLGGPLVKTYDYEGNPNQTPDPEYFMCSSLWWCFLSHLSISIRNGGVAVGETDPCWGGNTTMQNRKGCENQNDSSEATAWRLLYDFSFFVVVITILLNVVFGIIIDSFSSLRERKEDVAKYILNWCFVCNIEKEKFTSQGIAFSRHIRGGIEGDHNLWNYLFFKLYIEGKIRTNYTYIEKLISDKLQEEDYSFMPDYKALCLPEQPSRAD